MTSSLVGSEMCIRDSLKRAWSDWALQPKLRNPSSTWDIGVCEDNDWRSPVSYTHLTLPTICSV
eukprot:6913650-Prorocentrum_lima.AAC.1